MAELVTAAPAVVLAVYAHPDDPEVACGGTLATWAASGSVVHLIVVCAGEKGSQERTADALSLAALRAREVAAAASVMGLASHELLGYPDGGIDDTAELRGRLVGAIRTIRPDAVVCPDPTAAFFGRTYVNHRDHRVIGWAVLDAVAPAAWSPLYFPEAGEAHHVESVYLAPTLEPDVYVDIAPGLAAKTEALRCHASQVGTSEGLLADAMLHRAEEVGRRAGVRHAEGFRLLTPS